MASDASHVLEAALEQMDGIIAGMVRGPGNPQLILRAEKPFPLIGLLFWVQREGPCWTSFLLLCVPSLFQQRRLGLFDIWCESRALWRAHMRHLLASV